MKAKGRRKTHMTRRISSTIPKKMPLRREVSLCTACSKGKGKHTRERPDDKDGVGVPVSVVGLGVARSLHLSASRSVDDQENCEREAALAYVRRMLAGKTHSW